MVLHKLCLCVNRGHRIRGCDNSCCYCTVFVDLSTASVADAAAAVKVVVAFVVMVVVAFVVTFVAVAAQTVVERRNCSAAVHRIAHALAHFAVVGTYRPLFGGCD